MKRGITSGGFEYSYDEARLDDMRFVDVLTVVVDPEAPTFEKIAGVSKLLTMILGAEMKEALYTHIGKTHDGRVPRADLEKALEEIMAGSDAEKNS